MFPVAPPRGPAAPVAPQRVGAPQSNTQPSPVTGTKPWTGETALTQAIISGTDAEAEPSPTNLDEESAVRCGGSSNGIRMSKI